MTDIIERLIAGCAVDVTEAMYEAAREIERLRRENVRVSCHCAALIQAMRDEGISDETIKVIADNARAA